MIGDDDRDVLLQIVEEDMAAFLMVNNEAGTPECLDHLLARERLAHRATSTSRVVVPGRVLIWFTFSKPSR